MRALGALALGALASTTPRASFVSRGACDETTRDWFYLWHGMGDTGEGLDELALALARRPSACARSVRIDGGGGDRYSSYVGDVAAQVSAVCEAVVGDETRRASGTTRTHALGF